MQCVGAGVVFCWLITVSVFLYLWYFLMWSFLPAASCPPPMPTGLPSPFLFHLLPVSPFPVFLSSPVLPAGAFLLCVATVTPRKVGRTVGGCLSWIGKACSATVHLTCSVGMPYIKRSWRVGVEEVKQAQGLWNTQLFVAGGIPRSFLIRGFRAARSEYVVKFTVAPDILINFQVPNLNQKCHSCYEISVKITFDMNKATCFLPAVSLINSWTE